MPISADLRINFARLRHRLDALGELGAIVGADGERGSARLALTDADKAGRDLVVGWMHDLGLDVRIDGIGNVIAIRAGRDENAAPVMTGSHIDTVRTGGLYDGNLGVLSGLEVIETLEENNVITEYPVAVGFFTNEEGARFSPDMMGSLVYVGGLSLEDTLDAVGIDGARVGTELERIGYVGSWPCPGLVPRAFVELHVEQGPVLEEDGFRIGAVEGVQGISWQELTIIGQSNHAGTTPMRLRKDPAFVAASIAVFVRELALRIGHPQVGTVGKIDMHPNLVNVVPGTATMTVDLRNTDEAVLARAEAELADYLIRIAAAEGVTIASRRLARFEPVEFDQRMVALVEATASSHGHTVMRLPSGAGHDAQMLARVCPTSMIFTPSHLGISHNPAEYTSDADLEAGANILLSVLLHLASNELPETDHTDANEVLRS